MNWSALLARLLVGLVVLTPSLAPGQTTETDPRPAPVPVTPSARQTEPQVDVERVDTEPVSVTSNGEPTEVKQDANPTSSAEEPAPDTYFIDLRDPPPVEEPPEDVKTNALTLDDTTDMIEESSGEAAPASDIPGLRLIRPAALGANREREPPRYVRSMAEHAKYFGLTGWDDLDWFDFGIEQRTRFEYRGNYYREDQETGRLTVMRSRVYLGMRDVLDPLRFAFEFEDARRFGDPIDDSSNINETSILQAYGELYFPDVGGPDHPLRVRFGRMSFDAIDRRLVARNRFRNTTNSFQGLRVTLGEQATDWEIDLFAVNPVERRTESRDVVNEDEWLYGATAYWRGWSPWVNLAPYYFYLDSNNAPPPLTFQDFAANDFDVLDTLLGRPAKTKRRLHTLGLHAFGVLGQSGFDYDFNVAFQFGDNAKLSHRAFAMHGELGYQFDAPTKPRVAVWVNYASGDRNPDDGLSQRFDRLFGASHSMYGYSDLFVWENMINPTLYLSVRPLLSVRMEALYRTYWLASKTDAWVVPGLQDSTGDSGRFIGQEVDLRVVYQPSRNLAVDLGYAYFMPGSFVSNTTDSADDSHFLYLTLTFRL